MLHGHRNGRRSWTQPSIPGTHISSADMRTKRISILILRNIGKSEGAEEQRWLLVRLKWGRDGK